MSKKTIKIGTIKGGYIPTPIENIHQHLQALSQGVGVQKAGKGKGSFQRKPKHKGRGWDHAS